MSVKQINEWIGFAQEALIKCKIANEKKEIEKNFRGQISSFGAAISMGNLKSAIAFFAQQKSADVPREKLLFAICYVLQRGVNNLAEKDIDMDKIKDASAIFTYVCQHDRDSIALKNKFLDASVALKLAMNLFTLT